MRILFITSVYPNTNDPGRGIYNRISVHTLAYDHQLTVIAPVLWTREWSVGPPAESGRKAVVDGIPVEYPRYFYTPKFWRNAYGHFMWWSVGRTVKRVVDQFRPDAVVGYWAHPDGDVVVRAAARAGVPAIIIVGGSDVLVLGRSHLRRAAIVRVLNAADAIVAVSEHLKGTLTGYGVSSEKIRVICTGVDRQQFSPGDRTQARNKIGVDHSGAMLLWVGNMVAIKNLPLLIESCAKLKSRGLTFKLYLIGDGPERRHIERMLTRLGLEGRVALVGAVPHGTLPDWYRAATVTVLTSHSEGIPNVLLESIACETPFVATRVGGIPELAQPGLDHLAEPDDVDSMVEALASALRDSVHPQERLQAPGTVRDKASNLVSLLESISCDRRKDNRETSRCLSKPALDQSA